MTMFNLKVNVGENATVSVAFDILFDEDHPYVDYETIEVYYKGINIYDTLDIKDLESIEEQIMDQWQELENQAYEADDGYR